MITLKENTISVEEYLAIRAGVNWKELKVEQAVIALDNSLYVVGAYDGDRLVGMGRIVGDRAVISYIQDLIVDPSYQLKGVGSMVLNALIEYVKKIRLDGSEMMLCLMCARGREPFYEKHGFIARPTDNLGPGMIQYIKEL